VAQDRSLHVKLVSIQIRYFPLEIFGNFPARFTDIIASLLRITVTSAIIK
jgi:hypothetical protein